MLICLSARGWLKWLGRTAVRAVQINVDTQSSVKALYEVGRVLVCYDLKSLKTDEILAPSAGRQPAEGEPVGHDMVAARYPADHTLYPGFLYYFQLFDTVLVELVIDWSGVVKLREDDGFDEVFSGISRQSMAKETQGVKWVSVQFHVQFQCHVFDVGFPVEGTGESYAETPRFQYVGEETAVDDSREGIEVELTSVG